MTDTPICSDALDATFASITYSSVCWCGKALAEYDNESQTVCSRERDGCTESGVFAYVRCEDGHRTLVRWGYQVTVQPRHSALIHIGASESA